MSSPILALVGLGSNLGDSRRLIAEAFQALETHSSCPIRKSSLWNSAPLYCPADSPLFVNAAAGLTIRAGETPETLLAALQALESQFGRPPKNTMNEPRVLDLDLISFGSETRDTARLVLPHPRAVERRFVLEPLAEIAPDVILPGQTKSVQQLALDLKIFDETQQCLRI